MPGIRFGPCRRTGLAHRVAICYDRTSPPGRPEMRSTAMSEVWLHTNRRALAMGMVLPMLGVLLGVGITAATWSTSSTLLRLPGPTIAGISLVLFLLIAWQLRLPRIARRGDELLFYLRSGPPEHVPLAIVEGFLLGQGPSYVRSGKPDASECANIVVRLAEKAEDFAHREVKPALGYWCKSYVTIRGTWCEPLSLAMVNRLNARLADEQRSIAHEATHG